MANEDASIFQTYFTRAILLVTPEITSEDSIIFEITAEILDFDNFLAETVISSFAPGAPNLQGLDPAVSGLGGSVFGQAPIGNYVVTRNDVLMRSRKMIDTTARIKDGGTIVLGGWTGERTLESTSGVPVLRNMPFLGKLLFSRSQRTSDRTTLLIFLTGNLVD